MGLAAASIFGLALLIGILKLVGAIAPYKYTGDGFCYIDWSDEHASVPMLLITLNALVSVVALNAAASCGTWQPKVDLALYAVLFVAAYFFWPIIGLSNLVGGFAVPDGIPILGAVLGHSQALWNPWLYGIRWRTSVLKHAPKAEGG